MANPFPAEWDTHLKARVHYLARLSPEKQDQLRGLVQIFLDEKEFEGCGGLVLTDEIRVTIAGYACVLLLGGQSDMYPELRVVLVYPRSYVAPHFDYGPGGTVTEGVEGRSGESWSFGNIVLSWRDVLRDATHYDRGRNVVFHEFAHQLDYEFGSAEGAPALPPGVAYKDWARVMQSEYDALIDSVESGEPTLLDEYGAESPAEFFAVATEAFFLKPEELKRRHLELYELLRLYYRQDPALIADCRP